MNIRMQFGKPKEERKIKDMVADEVGYTVEWAVQDGNLNEEFSIGEKGGTASVKVVCIKPGLYDVSFEKPIYKNPFGGE